MGRGSAVVYEDVEVGSGGGSVGVLFSSTINQTKFEETSGFLGFFETDHF